MNKNYLLLALMAAAAVTASADSGLYGYQTWQRGALTAKRGPVKIDPNNTESLTLLNDQSSKGVCYSGFYYNYKWYAQAVQPGTQSTFEGLYTIDINTGERTLVGSKGSKLVDMTYDYSTGKVLGVQSGNEYLASMDIATGAVTRLAKFNTASGSGLYIIALAADKAGQLYGIATSDTLYTIDKTTALCTPVGNTGVDAAYDQTMAFDYNTGTLYWANNGDYSLYTVDKTTGKATKLGALKMDGCSSSMGGLMVPYIDVAAGAPDRVTARKATVSGNSVTLSWTNPSIDAQGNALASLTAVKVMRNGSLLATVITSAIGQQASYTDKDLADGQYTYSLVPVNGKGDGGVETDGLAVTVGNDTPGQVKDFSVATGDSNAQLSWSAPDAGEHGGAFDPASITGYVVTRRAEGSTAATTINVEAGKTTLTDAPGFGRYVYSIAAANGVGQGPAVSAPQVIVKPANWIVMGQGAKAEVEDGVTYKFYDYSGTGYYPNNRRDTIVIVPKTPTSYVTADFTQFSLDTYGDSLKVFNGASVAAPLYGSFTAESVPAELKHVEATNTAGALTFVFFSDPMSRDQGWVANIAAVAKKANDMAATSLTTNGYPKVNEKVDYEVGVINKGVNTASGYKVQVKDASGSVLAEADGPQLASMAAATVKLSYVPKAAGSTTVTGYVQYGADADNSNNATAPASQRVLPEGSHYVSIAASTPSNLYVLPTSFLRAEAISETVYPASRIGVGAGSNLESLLFPYTKCSRTYEAVPIQVWVGETDADNLTAGVIPASSLTKFFDGKVNINAGDTELALTAATPYSYKGGNLVVLFYKNAPGTDAGDITFRGTFGDNGDAKCSVFDSKYDDTHFDPNATFGYSAGTMMADVNLILVPSTTAVETVGAQAATVSATSGAVVIAGNADAGYAVYGVDGREVAAGVGNATIALPAGVYVVKAGAVATKVLVK